MSHDSTRQAVAAALLLLLGGLAAGCAAHAPGGAGSVVAQGGRRGAAPAGATEAAASPAPLSPEALLARYEVARGASPGSLAALADLENALAEAEAALLAGDQEAAFDVMDAAVERALAQPLDTGADGDLRDRLDAVLAAMHDLARGGQGDGPVDGLAGELLEDEGQGPRLARLPEGHAFGIPMRDDPAVDSMIRFYTGRARERFEVGLTRAGRYLPTVRRILREEGMPLDLAWLVAVESNFNPHAYSRAHAKGLWQFIPSTGRLYGLRQDFWVDERADFEKATRSAVAYLRKLHGQFGDWHLALAAYNAGEGRVGRAIQATGRSCYWHLRETRHIRTETKNYVPAMLAVMTIMADPQAHGITVAPEPGLEWESVEVDAAADLAVLAECAGAPAEALAMLNPELKRGVTPAGAGSYRLRIPPGTRERFQQRLAALPPAQRLRWSTHVVRPGDTLSRVAAAHGASVAAVMAANNLSDPNRIRAGWSLVIPSGGTADLPVSAIAAAVPAGIRGAATVAAKPAVGTARVPRLTYRVRPGDTLSTIAQRHGVSVAQVTSWNGLSNANRIHAGQRLVLHATPARAAGGASRAAAARHHVVRPGDSLIAIARANSTTVAELRRANRLSGDVIHPGQRLLVAPAGRLTEHTVRPGDTLSAIARLYRTTVTEIESWNDLTRAHLIRPGDRILILAAP